MKKQLLLVLSSLFLLCGCTTNTYGSETSKDSISETESVSEQESIIDSVSEEDSTNDKTETIVMNDMFTAGSDMSQAADNQTFVAAFNTHEDLLSSAACTKIFFNAPNKKDGSSTYLVIGSGSSDGQLDLNFKVTIKKIELMYSNYYSYYVPSGSTETVYNIDQGKLLVNGNDISIDKTTEDVPTMHETIVTVNSNKITLKNEDAAQRVYISKIVLTY